MFPTCSNIKPSTLYCNSSHTDFLIKPTDTIDTSPFPHLGIETRHRQLHRPTQSIQVPTITEHRQQYRYSIIKLPLIGFHFRYRPNIQNTRVAELGWCSARAEADT